MVGETTTIKELEEKKERHIRALNYLQRATESCSTVKSELDSMNSIEDEEKEKGFNVESLIEQADELEVAIDALIDEHQVRIEEIEG